MAFPLGGRGLLVALTVIGIPAHPLDEPENRDACVFEYEHMAAGIRP